MTWRSPPHHPVGGGAVAVDEDLHISRWRQLEGDLQLGGGVGDAEEVLHTDHFGGGIRNQIVNFKAEMEVTMSKEEEWKETICDLPKGPVSAALDVSDPGAEHVEHVELC